MEMINLWIYWSEEICLFLTIFLSIYVSEYIRVLKRKINIAWKTEPTEGKKNRLSKLK